MVRAEFLEASISNSRGINVPIMGITLERTPIFKALNIKYAPLVQRRVEIEAKVKTLKPGM